MRVHELKVVPQFWEGLAGATKTFEIRRNDRHFQVGDTLILREYDHSIGFVSEATVTAKVSYILHAEDFPAGLREGYVILGMQGVKVV